MYDDFRKRCILDQFGAIRSEIFEYAQIIEVELLQKLESCKKCATEFLSNLQKNNFPSIENLLKALYDIVNNIKIAKIKIMDHIHELRRSSVKAGEQLISSFIEVESKEYWNSIVHRIKVSYPKKFLYFQSHYKKSSFPISILLSKELNDGLLSKMWAVNRVIYGVLNNTVFKNSIYASYGEWFEKINERITTMSEHIRSSSFIVIEQSSQIVNRKATIR